MRYRRTVIRNIAALHIANPSPDPRRCNAQTGRDTGTAKTMTRVNIWRSPTSIMRQRNGDIAWAMGSFQRITTRAMTISVMTIPIDARTITT